VNRETTSLAPYFVFLAFFVGGCTTVAGRRPAFGRAAALTEDLAKLEEFTLGEIQIHPRDIFPEDEAENSFVARVLNATHATTKAATIRNEFWLAPGDRIRAVDAEEFERNLRATGLFAEASVRLVETSDPAVKDLHIETKDRLTFSIGASGSFVGAVSSLGATLGESNVFGTGDRIAAGFSENSEGEFRGVFSYFDRQVAGSWVNATAQVGRTEEGDFAAVGFERPFKFLRDRASWRINTSTAATASDYFEAGDSVAEVPLDRSSVEAATFRRFGPAESTWTVGLRAQHDDIKFGTARGPQASTIDVPGDTTATLGGFTFGHRKLFGFRKVQGLDTLRFIQDVSLGAGFDALVGASHRTEEGQSDAIQPTYSLSTSFAYEPALDTFVSLRANARGRTEGGEFQGWATGLDATVFELGLRPHTLAAHVSFDEAFEDQGLPVQLLLGEDSGLRGFPAREFTGERVVRLNLEDRIDLQARLGAIEFGAVVFLDIGWIEERGQGFGRPLRSTGVGLRVGSSKLFGARVLRVDFSVPLDDVDGTSYDPLISLSLGQVFDFQ